MHEQKSEIVVEVCDPVPDAFVAKAKEEGERRARASALASNPVVVALMSMNRVQRRAFTSEFKRTRKRGIKSLASCWQAASDRGWRGEIPKATVTFEGDPESVTTT